MKKRIILVPFLTALISVMSFSSLNDLTPVFAAGTRPTQIDLTIKTDAEVRNYYPGIEGKKGESLLAALYPIIKDHAEYSYTSASDRTVFKIIDRAWHLESEDPSLNPIFDNFNYSTDNGFIRKLYGDYNDSVNEADRFYIEGSTTSVTFDKEHIWPQSLGGFGRTTGAGSDFHALWASDSSINSNGHSNFHFATPTINKTQRLNDKGTLGGYTGKIVGSTDTVFEPLDQYKGDIARAMFYMPARYFEYIDTQHPKLELVNGTPNPVVSSPTITGKAGDLATLLEWNEIDPVDEYEIRRNNLIANNFQGNRNPFIDYPQWARIAYDPSYVGSGASNASETSSVGSLSDEFSSYDLLSISLDVENVKRQYFLNETFTTANLTLIGHYSNGQSRIIRNFTSNIASGAPLTASGEIEIIISATHGGVTLTESYEISVDSKTLNESLLLSEVYGGGGNSGASYNYDFVELYNNSDFDINLRGKTVQYASSTGTNWLQTTLSGFIQARSYFLVRMGTTSVTTGSPLPLEDVTGTTSMAAGALKIALVNSTNKFNIADPTKDPLVIDFLGAGGANASYGATATAMSNNTTSYQRIFTAGVPSTENDNKTDYQNAAPTPLNSALSVGASLDTLNQGELQCLVYYPIYKERILNLTLSVYDEETGSLVKQGQKDYFMTTNVDYMNRARLRYEAWAIYLGDQDPYGLEEPLEVVRRSNLPEATLTPLIILSALFLFSFVAIKKKRELR